MDYWMNRLLHDLVHTTEPRPKVEKDRRVLVFCSEYTMRVHKGADAIDRYLKHRPDPMPREELLKKQKLLGPLIPDLI